MRSPGDTRLTAALRARHQELKRATEELRLEHERLRERRVTQVECHAHRRRLHSKRLELEEHYLRLRRFADQWYLDRQAAFVSELAAPLDD
jgi:hypothetical protein